MSEARGWQMLTRRSIDGFKPYRSHLPIFTDWPSLVFDRYFPATSHWWPLRLPPPPSPLRLELLAFAAESTPVPFHLSRFDWQWRESADLTPFSLSRQSNWSLASFRFLSLCCSYTSCVSSAPRSLQRPRMVNRRSIHYFALAVVTRKFCRPEGPSSRCRHLLNANEPPVDTCPAARAGHVLFKCSAAHSTGALDFASVLCF